MSQNCVTVSNVAFSEKVCGGLGEESTYDSSTNLQTYKPTDKPAVHVHYYTYRVTVPHSDKNKLKEILWNYSKNFIMASHNADVTSDKKGEHAEHFHCAFLDLDPSKVVAMKKQVGIKFGRKGNELHSGKFMDNTIYKGIQYFKHDPSVEFTWRGTEWNQIISDSPDWEDQEPSSKRQKTEVKEKPSFPIVTQSNVIKQALKWRTQHNINSTDLGVVCEHMTRVGNWQPTRDVMKNGLDPLHHRLFTYHASGKVGKTPDWWTPHNL